MEKLVAVAKDDRQNIMPITIEAVENGATMGEIVDALKKLWGTYRETPVF
jgi:methylmalonyl-CoA mutase N-terminal domain/subunit